MSLEKLRTPNRYSPPPATKKLYNKCNAKVALLDGFVSGSRCTVVPSLFVVKIVQIQRSANFEAMGCTWAYCPLLR